MSIVKTLVCLVLLLSCAGALIAQVEQAAITGIITDKTGAAVPDSQVLAENLETGVKTTGATNASGNFYLRLVPGSYRVTIRHDGFASAVVPTLALAVAQQATLNLSLEVSSVQQQVTVTELAPLIEQETASLGTTIDPEKFVNLPAESRNPYSLVTLAPGVNPKGNAGTGPLINGGRSNANAVLLDGGQVLNSTTNDTSYTPPLESVQQFRVQTSAFQAEYGRTAGGVLNVTTKMGTNQLHGALYEFFKNDALNANTYSNDLVGLSKAVVRHNEFGGAVGGPVWMPRVYHGRDRTFFFTAFEMVPDRAPQSVIATVPTAAQRSGDFSQTLGANGNRIVVYDPNTSAVNPAAPTQYIRQPFPNNTIPADRISPVSAKILAYYPLPNSPGRPVVGTQNFLRNGSAASNAKKLLVRIDHAVSASNRLFGRMGITKNRTTSSTTVNDAFPQQTSTAYEPVERLNTSTVIGDTVTFRPNLIGEFRGGYLRNHSDSTPTSFGFDLKQLGFAPSVAAETRAQIFPGIAATGMDPLGTATTALRLSVQENRQGQGVITWIPGRHTVKFGGDVEVFKNNTYSPSSPSGTYSFTAPFTQGPNPTTAGPNSGYALGSFLLGLPASGSLTLDPSLAAQQIYIAGFAQDTFKVTRGFTLDLGVRWEMTTPWTDRYNQLAYFDRAAKDAVTGLRGAMQFVTPSNRGQSELRTKNFGPRIGIAWLIAPRTTFRAGYGLFYAQGNRGVGAVSSELGQGFQTSTSVYLGPAGANPYLPPVGASFANPFVTGYVEPPSNLVGASVSTTLRDQKNPVQHQWTANFQRQLTNSLVVEAAYTGSRGQYIWADMRIDAVHPMYLEMGNATAQQTANPFYGKIATGTLSAATVAVRQLLLPYPQYTGVSLHYYPCGDSSYHALTLKLDKRLSRGLTLLAAFTAGKQIDNVAEHFSGRTGVANPYDLRKGRSVADYDVPQRFVLSYIWQLPFGPGQARFNRGVLPAIVGNWQINGVTSLQKGMPVVITGPNTANLPGLTSQADRLRSGVLSEGPTPDRWFDTTAFASAPAYTLGTDSRTEPDLRGPGIVNFDFSLMRNQKLGEKSNLQFRAETYNIFNTPQLDDPDGSVTSPTFGRVLGGGANRRMQLGLRLYF